MIPSTPYTKTVPNFVRRDGKLYEFTRVIEGLEERLVLGPYQVYVRVFSEKDPVFKQIKIELSDMARLMLEDWTCGTQFE